VKASRQDRSRHGFAVPMMRHRTAAGFVLAVSLAITEVAEAQPLLNPVLGKPDAIEAGRDIYRAKCLVCHQSAGARGPNIFATKLSDEQFLETVINGRKGTQMPAFGERLSPDEVWQVHAFVKSTDHY
jgi:mono/diheme cytochrome c family protein